MNHGLSVLQCVAVCCSLLQYVAVFCSALQGDLQDMRQEQKHCERESKRERARQAKLISNLESAWPVSFFLSCSLSRNSSFSIFLSLSLSLSLCFSLWCSLALSLFRFRSSALSLAVSLSPFHSRSPALSLPLSCSPALSLSRSFALAHLLPLFRSFVLVLSL